MYFKYLICGMLLICTFSLAQERKDLDFKALRDEQIKKWGVAEVPDVNAITNKAEEFLSLPLDQQSIKQLEEIVEETNRAANFVDFIYDWFKDQDHRINLRLWIKTVLGNTETICNF